ncbi:MAG: protein-glutamate O-methyltransferase CheR [Candidatus Magnetomorum sp.]|nr:protein-glutamate O-methyltransferase CheR [Candidatus Magnetomorum sp.]
MNLSKQEYQRIRDFIYRKTGLFFEDRKLYFVQKRIEKRIEFLELETTDDYIRELQFRDPNGEELQAFLNILTTNETYFFREFDQLAAFAEHCLSEICERKRILGNTKLRVWSAGCSTGEEPYTLGIILKEMLGNEKDWLINILATDINTRVLNIAKKGVYEPRAIKDVPQEYLETWFQSFASERYSVHPIIKKMCSFEILNLMDRKALKNIVNVDFIFCRNVLIYFDNDSRKQVVSNFYDILNPGGYIYLGHSESMTRISSAFKIRRKGGYIVYQKPE